MVVPSKSSRLTRLRRVGPALFFPCAQLIAQTADRAGPLSASGRDTSASSVDSVQPVCFLIFDLVADEGSLGISPIWLGVALAIILILSFVVWSRENRLKIQRERLRKTYQLGEEVLGSSSSESILKRLSESLPGILGVSRIQLYVYNRAGKMLELVGAEDREPASISLTAPAGGAQSGAVACFHYRTLLVIPDIERSPFPVAGPRRGLAKS